LLAGEGAKKRQTKKKKKEVKKTCIEKERKEVKITLRHGTKERRSK
jgi:hypothetical protein